MALLDLRINAKVIILSLRSPGVPYESEMWGKNRSHL